jgi:hypothetical protein
LNSGVKITTVTIIDQIDYSYELIAIIYGGKNHRFVVLSGRPAIACVTKALVRAKGLNTQEQIRVSQGDMNHISDKQNWRALSCKWRAKWRVKIASIDPLLIR